MSYDHFFPPTRHLMNVRIAHLSHFGSLVLVHGLVKYALDSQLLACDVDNLPVYGCSFFKIYAKNFISL